MAGGEVGGEGAVPGHEHGVVVDSAVAAAYLHLDGGPQRWGNCGSTRSTGRGGDGGTCAGASQAQPPTPRELVQSSVDRAGGLGRQCSVVLTGGSLLLALGGVRSVGEVGRHGGGCHTARPSLAQTAWSWPGGAAPRSATEAAPRSLISNPQGLQDLGSGAGGGATGRARLGTGGAGPTHVGRTCRAGLLLPEGLRRLTDTPCHSVHTRVCPLLQSRRARYNIIHTQGTLKQAFLRM